MDPRAKVQPSRYISTTMSSGRTLKQRWINGFKLAFFGSVLFGLVGLPFSIAEDVIDSLVKDRGCGPPLIWLGYGVVALLIYPVLFDWVAAAFRIQFVQCTMLGQAKPSACMPRKRLTVLSEGSSQW